MKRVLILPILLPALLLWACREPSVDMEDFDPADQKLVEFYFDGDDNDSLEGRYKASFQGSILYVSLPSGTNRSSLKARFEVRGRGLQVNGVWQESGSSVQDFSSAVYYDLIKTDGSRIQYAVVAGYGEISGNSLYEFSFNGPGNAALHQTVTARIEGSNVTFDFPFGTNIQDMVASFVVPNPTNTTVKYNGITLTSAVGPLINPSDGGMLTVEFEDGSSRAYSVQTGTLSREAVYVSTGGAVGAAGTQNAPLNSLQEAVARAQAERVPEIRIAVGAYAVPLQIVFNTDIRIKGGYSANDWSDRGYLSPANRNNAAYMTILNCGDATAGAALDFRGGITFSGSAVTGASLLEGLILNGANADYASGVSVRDGADPVLRYVDIVSGTGDHSAAVFVHNASPSVYSSTVKGNAGLTLSFGLSVLGGSADPELVSCIVSSTNGNTANQGYALDLDGGAGGRYSNNYFEGHGGNDKAGLRLMSAGGTFYNNIFGVTVGGGTSACIAESGAGNRPDLLMNSSFSNRNDGNTVLYRKDGGTDLKTLAEINALGYGGFSNNFAYYHVNRTQFETDAAAGTLPPTLAFSGQASVSGWNRSLKNIERSVSGSKGWSIGPFEIDSCGYDTESLGFTAGGDGSYDGNWGNLSISEAVLIADGWEGTKEVFDAGAGGYNITTAPVMKITSNLRIINNNAAITFQPPPGQSVFVIDDGDSGTQREVFIKGLDFSGINRGGQTGGALISRENSHLYDCVFRTNTADAGAAIYQEGGALSLANVVFSTNHALNGPGAGVYVRNGSFKGMNLIFCDNDVVTGGNGAAAYFENSPASIVNSTITSNDATNTTAAVYALNGDMVIRNSIFHDNTAGLGLADAVCAGGNMVLNGSIMQSATFSTWSQVTQTLANPGFTDTTTPFGTAMTWRTNTHELHATDNGRLMVNHGYPDYLPEDWFDADGDGNRSEPFPYDMAKQPRQVGASVDAGAYESF